MTVLDRVTDLDELRAFVAVEPWEARQTDLEGALEGWVEAIAKEDRRAGQLAALACAEHALPVIAATAEASGLDFGGPDQTWGDAFTPREQLAAARAFLEDGKALPDKITDYTRQLDVWDEDLRPDEDSPEGWFVYFVEATNLLLMALKHDEGGGPYGTWRGSMCAARSAVCSYKAMHRAGDDREVDASALIDAIRGRTAAG